MVFETNYAILIIAVVQLILMFVSTVLSLITPFQDFLDVLACLSFIVYFPLQKLSVVFVSRHKSYSIF